MKDKTPKKSPMLVYGTMIDLGCQEIKLRDHPWMSAKATKFLESILTARTSMLEIGAGGSTIWLAKRVKKLVSLEHHIEWHKAVSKELMKRRITNTTLILDRYYAEHLDVLEEKFNVILVDGYERGKCLIRASKMLKPGGYIILDDVAASLKTGDRSIKLAVEYMDKLGWKRRYFEKGHSTMIWKRAK